MYRRGAVFEGRAVFLLEEEECVCWRRRRDFVGGGGESLLEEECVWRLFQRALKLSLPYLYYYQDTYIVV